MRWKIVHSVCANVVRRSTCAVGLEGGTEISTIKLNNSLCTDFRRHNVCHAPCWRARSLIQFASYPRSASNIVFGSTALRRTEHSRLSCASPGVRARCTGRPLVSTTAWILLVRPPREPPYLVDRYRRRRLRAGVRARQMYHSRPISFCEFSALTAHYWMVLIRPGSQGRASSWMDFDRTPA
jgi:hypothetical protein